MKDSNVNMILSSGFRDYQNQEELFNQEVADDVASGVSKEESTKEASIRVDTPGMSEHQLGLAADFAIPGELLTEDFKNTIGLPHSEIVTKKNIIYDEYTGNLRKDRTLTYL